MAYSFFLRCLLCCVAALCCAFAEGPARAAGEQSPLAVLETAQLAVDSADPDLFFQVVDGSAVLGDGSEAFLEALAQGIRSGELKAPNDLAGFALGALAAGDTKQLALLKGLFISEARSFVSAGIRGGYFAGNPNGAVGTGGMLYSPALKKMGETRKELLPGTVLSNDGKTAVISATLRDGNKEFPLRLRTVRREAGWQVTAIENVSELLQGVHAR